MNFYERVYELVQGASQAGKCASYGQLALMLGNPGPPGRWATQAGLPHARRALPPGGACRRLHHPSICPGVQRAMLEAEGVPFTADGRVELGGCRWDGA